MVHIVSAILFDEFLTPKGLPPFGRSCHVVFRKVGGDGSRVGQRTDGDWRLTEPAKREEARQSALDKALEIEKVIRQIEELKRSGIA